MLLLSIGFCFYFTNFAKILAAEYAEDADYTLIFILNQWKSKRFSVKSAYSAYSAAKNTEGV
jgi:endonuclease/exonuclease/phosphatase (EEP) superfamily protein YafD